MPLPSPRPAPHPVAGTAARIAAGLLVAEAGATALDLAWGGLSALSTEERFNAQAAAHLACGHLEALLDLRYRPFCGGCSAEALVAAPLYRLLGPTVLAWKLVPAALHLVAATCGTLLAGRAGGPRAALAAAALTLGAPMAWRTLALTGFGNHAEGMAPVLAAGLLLAVGLDRAPGPGRAAILLVAGALAGAAVSFVYTAAFGAVALGLVALQGVRRGGGWALVGLPLGLAPLLLFERARPGELAGAQVTWAGPSLAPPADLWRWLVGDLLTGTLWPGVPAPASGAAWLLLIALALVGLARAWRTGPAGRWLVLATLTFVAATALRHDLWQDHPPLQGWDWFHLRYRTPLALLLPLGAALSAGRSRLALALCLALGLAGAGLRIGSWRAPADLGEPVLIAGFHPDRSVPEGPPPRRVPRLMGRPQDLLAARAFVDGHADPMPACRADHLAELGRRAALASAAGDAEAARAALQGLAAADLPAVREGLRRGAERAGLSPDEAERLLP